MTKLVAYAALLVAALGLMLGNYWFTFGFWPKSWPSFFGFGMASIAVALILEAIKKEH